MGPCKAQAEAETAPAVVCSLTSTASLVRVEVAGKAAQVRADAPELVLVVDRSGSMSSYFTNLLTRLGQLAASLHCPSVQLITFNTEAQAVETTPADLLSRHVRDIRAGGGTMIGPVLPHLERVLRPLTGRHVQLVVVSDGAVSDKECFLKQVQALPVAGALLQVVGVRLKTGCGQADTRALTGFFNLHALPGTQPKLLEWDSFGSMAHVYLLELADALARPAPPQHVACTPAMRAFPWTAPAASHMLPAGTHWLILQGAAQGAEAVSVSVGGRALAIVASDLREDDLADYLDDVANKVRVLQVLGREAATLDGIFEFVRSVQARLQEVESQLAAQADTAGGTRSCLADRVRQLRRAAASTHRSATTAILQLANADRVAAMNSDQQAVFLRQGKDCAAMRRLAQRTVVGGEDITATLHSSLAKLAGTRAAAGAGMGADEGEESFYSRATDEDVLECVRADVAGLQALPLESILQVVGQVGVAFTASVGTLPDPWQFVVRRVHPRVFLSQNDLWATSGHGGSAQAQLRVPGGDDMITGVVPLQRGAFAHTVFPRLHASICMRRMVAPVPEDEPALLAAVLVCLAGQLMWAAHEPSEGSVATLAALVRELRDHDSACKGAFLRALPDDLPAHQDGHLTAHLTGRKDITGINRVAAYLLCRTLPVGFDWPNLARVLYSLQCYHTVKRHFRSGEDNSAHIRRMEAVRACLGINLAAHATPVGAPLQPDPPAEHYDRFCVDTLVREAGKYSSKVEGVFAVVQVARRLQAGHASEEALKEALAAARAAPVAEVFGVDNVEQFVAASTVQALLCEKVEDRVDDKQHTRLAPLATEEERSRYLAGVVRAAHAEDHAKRLAAKRKEEAEMRLAAGVDEMVADATDTARFVELLRALIPGRHGPEFGLLWARLKRVSRQGKGASADEKARLCKGLRAKFRILITGRKGEEAVWCHGNAMRGGFDDLQGLFREEWADLVAYARAHSFHVYRIIPNRHGYGNARPSWWALGYASKAAMEQDAGRAHVLDAYLKAVSVA
mmetsp:Transcript_36180/g.90790  ORF Transcript_36180/g.90790 Transcript_36180/m.90790 type:complete len:1026 (+) Transcript_36180:284-3361(+)